MLGTGLGVIAGTHAGWRRGRWADRALVAAFTAGRGVPPFFIASMALFIFAVKLEWFPLFGAATPFAEHSGFLAGAADVARHLVLPASIGTLLFCGSAFLIMRSSMVSELGADYLLMVPSNLVSALPQSEAGARLIEAAPAFAPLTPPPVSTR